MSNAKVPAVVTAAIKEQQIDAAKVNLLLPSETFGQVLGEYDKVTMEVVSVDSNPAAGDVYAIEGKKALSRVVLQKISTALSIIWDPEHTGIVEETPMLARAKATGAMRKPNGEWVVVAEEKTIDLSADEESFRLKYEEEAEKGNFTGDVIEWGSTKSGKRFPKAFTPWKSDAERDTAIDRAVRRALLQRRKFKSELAMTGAKNRVIRAFVGIKSSYTDAELSKPFAFPRVTTDSAKLFRDPAMRDIAVQQMNGSVQTIFGPGAATREEKPERPAISADTTIVSMDEEELDEPEAMPMEQDIVQDDFETAEETEEPTTEDPRWSAIIEYEEAFILPPSAEAEIAQAREQESLSDEYLNGLTGRIKRWCEKHPEAQR